MGPAPGISAQRHTTPPASPARVSTIYQTLTKNPPLVWVLMDEAILMRAIGGAKAMHEQLLYLAHLADQPHVTIQVVPMSTGAHCGLIGGFAVANVDGAGDIAYLDTVTDGYIVESAAMVARVNLIFDTLRSLALPRGAFRDLIMKRAEEYGPD